MSTDLYPLLREFRSPAMRTFPLLVAVLISLVFANGCALTRYPIDASAVERARHGLSQSDERDRYYALDEWDDDDTKEELPERGSVFVGELLAIFPGMFVHGLGHLYAGDKQTFRRLSRMGQFGYLLLGVGGGTIAGAYLIDDKEVLGDDFSQPVAYGLYATGGAAAGGGLVYFLSAWIYDIVDTPRAVRSRGRPPARTPFVDSLDVFD